MQTQNTNQTKHWSQLGVGEWLERETAVSRWFIKGSSPASGQSWSRSNLLSIIHTHTQSRLLTHLEEGQSSIIYIHTHKIIMNQGHNNGAEAY